MNSGTYITYPTQYSNIEIANAVAKLEAGTTGVKKDLLIVALMVMVLGFSDGSIIKDEARLRKGLEDLSHQVAFIVSGTNNIDPKDMN